LLSACLNPVKDGGIWSETQLFRAYPARGFDRIRQFSVIVPDRKLSVPFPAKSGGVSGSKDSGENPVGSWQICMGNLPVSGVIRYRFRWVPARSTGRFE
jgi:hypothetical protein